MGLLRAQGGRRSKDFRILQQLSNKQNQGLLQGCGSIQPGASRIKFPVTAHHLWCICPVLTSGKNPEEKKSFAKQQNIRIDSDWQSRHVRLIGLLVVWWYNKLKTKKKRGRWWWPWRTPGSASWSREDSKNHTTIYKYKGYQYSHTTGPIAQCGFNKTKQRTPLKMGFLWPMSYWTSPETPISPNPQESKQRNQIWEPRKSRLISQALKTNLSSDISLRIMFLLFSNLFFSLFFPFLSWVVKPQLNHWTQSFPFHFAPFSSFLSLGVCRPVRVQPLRWHRARAIRRVALK